jgi:hypothetical protein
MRLEQPHYLHFHLFLTRFVFHSDCIWIMTQNGQNGLAVTL